MRKIHVVVLQAFFFKYCFISYCISHLIISKFYIVIRCIYVIRMDMYLNLQYISNMDIIVDFLHSLNISEKKQMGITCLYSSKLGTHYNLKQYSVELDKIKKGFRRLKT